MKSFYFFRCQYIDALIAADVFSALNPNPICMFISLPTTAGDDDAGYNACWSLCGGVARVVPMSDRAIESTVKDLKQDVYQELCSQLLQLGAPASTAPPPVGKIQLKHHSHGFLKDASSLAALNLLDGCMLELSVKSRGGKK